MTPLSWYGIHIIDAYSPTAEQYGEVEIQIDAQGGFERYKWQAAGSASNLWRVSAQGDTLIAAGYNVPAVMEALLRRAHTTEALKLSYREFQILVDGWVDGWVEGRGSLNENH